MKHNKRWCTSVYCAFYLLNHKNKEIVEPRQVCIYLINDMLLHTFKIGSVYNVPVYLKAGKIHDGKTSTTIELEEVKEFCKDINLINYMVQQGYIDPDNDID